MSAPISPSICEQNGPASARLRSRTRRPSSGKVIAFLPFVEQSADVNDHYTILRPLFLHAVGRVAANPRRCGIIADVVPCAGGVGVLTRMVFCGEMWVAL